MRFLFALLACVALVSVAPSQTTDPSFFEWRQDARSGTQWNLFRLAHCINRQCFPEKQMGAYAPETRTYRELQNGGTWSVPKAPPIPLPADVGKVDPPAGQVMHFGVDEAKRAHRDKVTFKGSEITMADAHKLAAGFADATLPDDGKKPHLTIAARDAAAYQRLAAQLGDFESLPLAERYRIQLYDVSREVDRAMMAPFLLEADPRFKKDGVVCLLQEPAGIDGPAKVLCAVGDFEKPAKLIEAVRAADPLSWDPNKAGVPSSMPAVFDWIKGQGGNWILWALAAVGAFAGVKAFGIGGKLSSGWERFKILLQPSPPPPPPVVVQAAAVRPRKRSKPAAATPAASPPP